MVAELRDLIARDPDGVRAQLSRDNLIVFTRRLFPAYRAAPHHWRIAQALEAIERGDIDRLVLTVPPRHGKSTLASINFPAWFLGRNPDSRIIAASYASTLAYRFSRQARNLLAHPLWPFDVQTAGDLANVQTWDIADHRGGYLAAGVGSGIAGHGADVLLVDDPVRNAEEADSETYRENTWDWFNQDAVTRLEPGGRIVLIGTRWHEDDLIGRALASGEAWERIDLPALDHEARALWPERFSADALARIKTQIGSRAWEALYQQRPSAAEGGTFKRHWWRFWHHPGQPLPPVPARMADGSVHLCPCLPLPPFWDEHLASWDMTFKDTKDSDYVCGQIWGAWRADRYLLDQTLAQLDFPATLAAFRELSERWPRARRKLVEDKANGPAVIATLRNDIAGIVAVEPDGGKVSRANAVTAEVESGNAYLPHPRLAPWVDAYIEELANFPTGKHDDQVDATSQALLRLQAQTGSTTTSTSYVDQTEDEEAPDRRWSGVGSR